MGKDRSYICTAPGLYYDTTHNRNTATVIIVFSPSVAFPRKNLFRSNFSKLHEKDKKLVTPI